MASSDSWRRFQPVAAFAALYLTIGALLRLVLWWQFGPAAGVGPGELLRIMPDGVVNDAVQSLYLLLPFSLYLLLPDRWHRSLPGRVALLAGAAITAFLIIYLAAVEYYFFQEFSSRFNLVASDYLIYPHEVFNDIWEAYPVTRVASLAALAAAALLLWLRAPLFAGYRLPTRLRHRLVPLAAHLGLLLVASVALRTDTLAPSGNRVAGQLAINGHAQFFEALRSNEIDYHAYYRSVADGSALRRLAQHLRGAGGTFVRLGEGRLDRQFAARPAGLGKLNVVVVMEESLGAEFSRLLHGHDDLTPNLDRYAQQGLWFTNMYADGTRTVRGLEAISASFPPIPTVSIVRRPNNQRIATWGKVMREAGYSSVFMYGGFGYFDNMNAFFEGNGYDVVDRTQITTPRFANIWGVSDEDLFDAALADFDQRAASGRPFFAQIMTTSNHKPFTFRPGLPGIPERGGGRAAGVRYADYALGYFLEQARRHPWFGRTLFVIVADHGARVYGKAQIPLKSYEIPCVLWAPGLVQPQRVDALASQMDIAPTVLGLLGFAYRAPFFGVDLLSAAPQHRVALVNHNHDVALYSDGRLVVLGLQQQVAHYAYDRGTDSFTLALPDPDLEQLAVGYYQTAADLFETHRYE